MLSNFVAGIRKLHGLDQRATSRIRGINQMVRKHLQCHRTNPTSPQYPRHQGRARDATSSLRRSNTGPYPRERTHRASGFPVHACCTMKVAAMQTSLKCAHSSKNLRDQKLETLEARKAHAIPSKSSIRHGMHPHSVNRPALTRSLS